MTPEHPPAQRTLHGWFAESARRFPSQTALEVAGQHLTYRQLDARAAQFALALSARQGTHHGGPFGPRVGLLATRSVNAYVAYLGTLRAGGVVVPLNPAYPAARNRLVAERAELDVVVADTGQDTSFAEDQALPVLHTDSSAATGVPSAVPDADPDALAYVLFTSGSTGRPKGVPIRHRNLDTYLRHNIARYQVAPGCRLSQTFDLTFDPSVFDMFVAWGAGATLVVPSRDDLFDPVGFVNDRAITHWYSVPSIIAMTRESGSLMPGSMPGLRWSLFAGEPLTLDNAAAWADAADHSTVENLYGPTELSVTVSAHRLPADRREWPRTANGTVPIGTVYPHLDHRIAEDTGELQVRGPQRFEGYLDATDNTDRFVPQAGPDGPDPDAWYRTGDRIAWHYGSMVHLGRLDQQLKILGQRVELQEIEHALRTLAGLADAVVVPYTGNGGDLRLAAVYTGDRRTPAEVRELLRHHLPAHMVPRRYTHVDRLPLNAHGKIDRIACAAAA
ncbi:AMP-binding protein [Streptomyces sp. NPDC051001]|uniref:AMP-binding protein n=1 Tax=Streptomyces sp. NPDC051001 TaxID=3155795 RepID=UPI003430A038